MEVLVFGMLDRPYADTNRRQHEESTCNYAGTVVHPLSCAVKSTLLHKHLLQQITISKEENEALLYLNKYI